MRALLSFTLLLSSVSFALAEESNRESKKISQAKAHYFSGERAYRLGEFERAVEEFKKSYDLNPLPKVLFNLGQAYYKKNDLLVAKHIFKQFVETNPNDAETGSAKQRLDEIEKRLADEAASPKLAEEPPKPAETSSSTTIADAHVTNTKAPRQPRSPASKATIALGTMTLVCAGVGAGLLGHGFSLDPWGAMSLGQQRELDTQASNEKIAGIALLGVAGAALIGTAISFGIWMHERRVAKASHASVGGDIL